MKTGSLEETLGAWAAQHRSLWYARDTLRLLDEHARLKEELGMLRARPGLDTQAAADTILSQGLMLERVRFLVRDGVQSVLADAVRKALS